MLSQFLPELITTNKLFLAVEGIALFLILFVIFKLILAILHKFLDEITSRTKTTLDQQLLKAVKKPLEYGIILLSANITFLLLIPDFPIGPYWLSTVFQILWVLLFAYATSTILNAIVQWYAHKLVDKGKTNFDKEILPALKRFISLIIYISAALIIFNALGIAIGPLLAGLGIAGLAVALALQESLVNFFAGLYLLADKPIRIGDYIKVDAGYEGFVDEIGWRSTRVRTLINTIVVIPNSKLTQSIITNFSLPTKTVGHSMKIYISYYEDIDKVRKLLYETTEKLLKTLPVAISSKPTVEVSDLQYDVVEITIGFEVRSYIERSLIENSLRSEILNALKANNVKIAPRV